MYTELATRLVVTTTAEVSQPVSMAGANAVLVDGTVFYNTTPGADQLTVALEGSNDLQNWLSIATAVQTDQIEYFSSSTLLDDVSFAYVRLKYSMNSGTSVISAGINVWKE